MEALQLINLCKYYGSGEARITAIDNVSLTLGTGTFTALVGSSGSGKSTLMNCAAGLEQPDSGTVVLGGTNISGMKEKQLTAFRRAHVGLIFQSYNLLPALSVQDNITLPLRFAGIPLDHHWAETIIETVGLSERLHHFPVQLSGGQQQRVAVARALITRPDLVLADEPTGALDTVNRDSVLALLNTVAHDLKQTVLMITHDPIAASHADQVVVLADGKITATVERASPAHITEYLSTAGTVL